MGDRTSVIECARLEDLARIPKSEKEPLLRVREGDIGYLTIRVESHDYLVTRVRHLGIRVCRLDVQDLSPVTRFFQAIKEFFTHQVGDFFQLRGVGTRSYRIGKTVESWMRFPDGQENAEGPPIVVAPTVTIQKPGKRITEACTNYVADHLANHSSRVASGIKISKACKPLSDRAYAWRDDLLTQIFGLPTAPRSGKKAIELDCRACESELFGAFDCAGEQAQQAFSRLYAMMHAIVATKASANAGPLPIVTRAKLLLLGNAISIAVSPELEPLKRSPDQAAELLGRLRTSWHQLNNDSDADIQCWQAARRLSRCGFGFQMLFELIGQPAELPEPVAEQWQAAMRIYLQSSDYLIDRSEAARREYAIGEAPEADRKWAGETAALRAWMGHPIGAANYAATMLADADHPRANRLAYRALLGAVKLMQIRAVADPAWLKAQRRTVDGESSTPSLTAPLSKDEIMALALWRNDFRDDLDDGLAKQFRRLLDILVTQWLPSRRTDLLTGAVTEVMPDDSPVALALGEPMTQAVTRRTVQQQSEDYQAAMGRMTRLLVLQLKMSAGVPLLRHEALLRDVLAFQGQLRGLEMSAEAAADLDLEFDRIFTQLDNVIRVIEIDEGEQLYQEDDLQRLCHKLSIVGNARTCLADIRETLTAMQARYRGTDSVLQEEDRLDVAGQHTLTIEQRITCLVRSSLLTQWLRCTELGMRLHTYTITDPFRSEIISGLLDIPGNHPHEQVIEAKLRNIQRIDLDVIDKWAVEAGMINAKTPAQATIPMPVASTELPELSLRFQVYRQVIAMLKAGRDKIDAGVALPETPRTREDFRRIAHHRMDINLGNGAKGSVSRTAGISGSVSIDAGAVEILAGPAPTISVSLSHARTTTHTGTFGIVSSSVGGQAILVSETIGKTGQVGAGITLSPTTALELGVDGSLVDREGMEAGMAIRAPASPGSREWVSQIQGAANVIFGKGLADKIEKDLAARPYQAKPARALRELCYQCFQPLLKGALALNVFDNRTSSETINAGISAGVTAKVKKGILHASVNARLGRETDRLAHQARFDRTGSTKLAVAAIGTGSRYSAAVRLLASLLPTRVTSHLQSGVSSGEVLGVLMSFRERGEQHFIRRETRDGIIQPSFAWDIVFRNVDDLIEHLNLPDVQDQWRAYHHSLTPEAARSELDRCMQLMLSHARDCRQTFMVRRYLADDKLAELNALTALAEGLIGASSPLGDLYERYDLAQRSRDLLTAKAHYRLGGFGVYAGDYREEEIGLHGGVMLAETRTVTVPTELLWFNARIVRAAPKSSEETVASESKEANPRLPGKPPEKSAHASDTPPDLRATISS